VEVQCWWGRGEALGRRRSSARHHVRWSSAEGGSPAAQDEAQRGEARLKFKDGARRSGSHRRGGAAASARWNLSEWGGAGSSELVKQSRARRGRW
jgi:hypothetical protein